MAGHRPRPALGRPARAGHPVRLPALRPARRGDDRERHHLPRPLGHPRGRQGLRLLRGAGRQARHASSATGATTSTAASDKSFAAELAAAGFDPEEPRLQHFSDLWTRIHNLPRHLGQHTGGMVIAAGRLDEVVPLEPASMPGRVVIQWDKDDCADLGIIKVDLLGPRHARRPGGDGAHHPRPARGRTSTSPTCRRTTPRSTGMLQRGGHRRRLPGREPRPDGLAAAQPSRAVLRPGDPGGDHPPRADRGRTWRTPTSSGATAGSRWSIAHPSLEPILERTLGVPIFQEQLLRVAMVAAGFTGGEAEELRRAMGSKRSVEQMQAIVEKLRRGMTARRDHRQGAGRDRAGDHLLRPLRLPRVARRELRADRLRQRLPEGAPSRPPSTSGCSTPGRWASTTRRRWSRTRSGTASRCGRWTSRARGAAAAGRTASCARGSAIRAPARRRRPGPSASASASCAGCAAGRRCRSRPSGEGALRRRRGPGAALRPARERARSSLAAVGALAVASASPAAPPSGRWRACASPAGPLLDRLPDPEPSPLPEMTPVEETQADYGGVQLTLGPAPARLPARAARRRRGSPPPPASTRSRTAPACAPPAR